VSTIFCLKSFLDIRGDQGRRQGVTPLTKLGRRRGAQERPLGGQGRVLEGSGEGQNKKEKEKQVMNKEQLKFFDFP
jgi:hypothetical protein